MRIIEYFGEHSKRYACFLAHINTYVAYKQSQIFENILQFIDQTLIDAPQSVTCICLHYNYAKNCRRILTEASRQDNNLSLASWVST